MFSVSARKRILLLRPPPSGARLSSEWMRDEAAKISAAAPPPPAAASLRPSGPALEGVETQCRAESGTASRPQSRSGGASGGASGVPSAGALAQAPAARQVAIPEAVRAAVRSSGTGSGGADVLTLLRQAMRSSVMRPAPDAISSSTPLAAEPTGLGKPRAALGPHRTRGGAASAPTVVRPGHGDGAPRGPRPATPPRGGLPPGHAAAAAGMTQGGSLLADTQAGAGLDAPMAATVWDRPTTTGGGGVPGTAGSRRVASSRGRPAQPAAVRSMHGLLGVATATPLAPEQPPSDPGPGGDGEYFSRLLGLQIQASARPGSAARKRRRRDPRPAAAQPPVVPDRAGAASAAGADARPVALAPQVGGADDCLVGQGAGRGTASYKRQPQRAGVLSAGSGAGPPSGHAPGSCGSEAAAEAALQDEEEAEEFRRIVGGILAQGQDSAPVAGGAARRGRAPRPGSARSRPQGTGFAAKPDAPRLAGGRPGRTAAAPDSDLDLHGEAWLSVTRAGSGQAADDAEEGMDVDEAWLSSVAGAEASGPGHLAAAPQSRGLPPGIASEAAGHGAAGGLQRRAAPAGRSRAHDVAADEAPRTTLSGLARNPSPLRGSLRSRRRARADAQNVPIAPASGPGAAEQAPAPGAAAAAAATAGLGQGAPRLIHRSGGPGTSSRPGAGGGHGSSASARVAAAGRLTSSGAGSGARAMIKPGQRIRVTVPSAAAIRKMATGGT